jgi:glycerol kinase
VARYILALDQGTTSSRSILIRRNGSAKAVAQREFPQIFPEPGHVEHDPEAIWKTQLSTAKHAIRKAGAKASDIAAIGITNQRETIVLWEKATGKPVHNAIVWQSRITAPICDALKKSGREKAVRKKTGLVLDPYFSGTKIKYLLDNVRGLRRRAEKGEILCGTIDTFLLWRLTGGQVHATDYSNASRTLLFNIHTLDWDAELLKMLRVPKAMLPEVKESSTVFGTTDPRLFGKAIPIAAMAGDQQAATFGQCCFRQGMVKNTYGTGCFMLMNVGPKPVPSKSGLLTTIGWGRGGKVTYCLEGSVFIAGAAVQWLRDGLGLIKTAADIEKLAKSVNDTEGVFFVPAFVGLGAPHWDPHARGVITGLTRGATKAHLARATLEAMGYQTRELVEAMERDAGTKLTKLRVDGGASANDTLMQFQADILGAHVQRPVIQETTALGAAYMAGLAVGYWDSLRDVTANWALDQAFKPAMKPAERRNRYAQWKEAVKRAR